MRRGMLPVIAAVLALAACTSQDAAPLPPPTTATATAAATAPTDDTAPTEGTAPTEDTSPAQFVTGLTIPWAVGGKRQFRDGTTKQQKGEWPATKVPAIRLWDGFTAWANIQPTRDMWQFTRLDRFVDTAIANGTTDITLVLAGTPQWAATTITGTDAPWIGPGSASMPKDIELWREYVDTVVTRYSGRITAYEIGNEPNMAIFWTGTDTEYQELVQVAAEEITAIDPTATIIAQAGLVRRPKDVANVARYASLLSTIKDIDVISVHVYPRAKRLDEAPTLLAGTKAAITTASANGAGNHPAWVTEVNVSRAGTLKKKQQAKAITELSREMQQASFARAYWYSWTSEGAPGLIPLHTDAPAAAALYAQFT